MPRDPFVGASGDNYHDELLILERLLKKNATTAKKHSKSSRAREGGKGSKGGKGGKGSKQPKALHVHATAAAGSTGRSQTGAGGTAGSAGQAGHTSSAHAGSASAAWVLAGSGTGGSLTGYDGLDRLPGISGVLLDLVGEGRVGLSHALAGWQREQERVANRTWRRPGGLALMGGL